MIRVDVIEAQERLEELIEMACNGEIVLICIDSEPVARLIPVEKSDRT